jgi:hypothetical protein
MSHIRSDIYSIQLKAHIVKFNIHEQNFTKFICNQIEKIKSEHTSNNLQYQSELNYNI